MFGILALAAFQSTTGPCLQSIMSKFVSDNRQGSLQVRIKSL